MSTVPAKGQSPFSFTFDLTRVLIVAVLGVVALGVVYVANVVKPLAPACQPSVPSLIPPPLSCLCGTTRAVTKPFSVVCPYCRNTLSVRPSDTGESVGATVPQEKRKGYSPTPPF